MIKFYTGIEGRSALQKQIEQLKELRIKEIIEDNTISKGQKLSALRYENLFDVESSIARIFDSTWGKEFSKQIEAAGWDNWTNNDFIIQTEQNGFGGKGKTIYFDDVIERIGESFFIEEDWEDTDDEMMDVYVVTKHDYSSPHGRPAETFRFRKTKEEVIDFIYDYCIKNRVCGFKYDW